MADIGTLSVILSAITKPLTEGLDKAGGAVSQWAVGANRAIGQAEKDYNAKFKNIGNLAREAGMAMTVAGGAIVGALGLSVKAYADSEKAGAQLDAALKSTHGAAGMTRTALDDLARSLSHSTAFEDDAITASEALLLTFTKIGRDTFPQAQQAVLNMATALNMDLKSASIMVGKALNDPVAGITAMRRAGVQFSVDQQQVIAAMVKTGNLAGAQKMILQELATEFGGSAEAYAKTFGGQLAQMKNEFGNMMEDVGKALVPALASIAKSLTPVIQKIAEWMEKNPKLTQSLVVVVGAIGSVMVVIGPMVPAMLFFAKTWESVSAAIGVAGPAITGIKALIAGLGTASAGILGTAILAIGAFWAGWKIGEQIAPALQPFFDWAYSKITGLSTAFQRFATDAEAAMERTRIAAEGAARAQSLVQQGYKPASSNTYGGGEAHVSGGVTRSPIVQVGERGPELAALPIGTRVMSNADMRAAVSGRGGGDINISMNGVTVREEADIGRIARELNQLINRDLRARGALA